MRAEKRETRSGSSYREASEADIGPRAVRMTREDLGLSFSLHVYAVRLHTSARASGEA